MLTDEIKKKFNIESMFQSYIKALFPGLPTDSAQYKETRRAFYSGCHIMQQFSFSASEYGEEQAVEILLMLGQETSDFVMAEALKNKPFAQA